MSKANLTKSNLTYSIIGTPFSTFTRSITLGLQFKGIKYTQIATRPQSSLALENHPFGYLPTLVIHRDGSGESIEKGLPLKIRESQAIVRYIDLVAPDPSLLPQILHTIEENSEDGYDALILETKMWEFVSLAASFGFPVVEGMIVKPRLKALDEGKLSEVQIREQIKDGVPELNRYLDVVEFAMSGEYFAFGVTPTWADFFLYPLLADLRMMPEWKSEVQYKRPRLVNWMQKMDELPAVQATLEGTLSVGARPPDS